MSKLRPKITPKDLESMATIEEFRANPVMAAELLLQREYAPIQRYMIWGMWFHSFSMLDSGRGTGKMVDATTRLMTNKGMQQLGDLLPSEILNHSSGFATMDASCGTSIMTPEGMRKVKRWMTAGKVKTLKITTSRGFQIVGCDENPMLQMKDGQLKWSLSGELKVGDYLAISRDASSWEYQDNGLNKDTARMLGYLVGDGNFNGESAFVLTNADELVIEDYCISHEKHFGFRPNVSMHHISKKTFVAITRKKDARKMLLDLGVERHVANGKEIPSSIWQASREAQAQFLTGLFEADGTADKRGAVSLCTVSEKLAREVQYLLSTFKIMSKIRKKKTHYLKDGKRVACQDAYMVEIYSRAEAIKFYDEIGFFSQRKQSRKSLLAKNTNSNNDIIPGLSTCYKAILKCMPRSSYGSGRNNDRARLKSISSGMYQTTYEKLPEMIQMLSFTEHPSLEYLEGLNKFKFFYDPIISIEKSAGHMFDVEIEPMPNDKIKHGFIANGFILHNCVWGESLVRTRSRRTRLDPWTVSYNRIQDLFAQTNQRVTFDNSEWLGFPPRKNLEVWTLDPNNTAGGFTWKPVQAVFMQKIQPDGMVIVQTIAGRKIMCTPSHKFLVKRKDDVSWIKAKDLSVGQLLHVCKENRQMGYEEVVSVEPVERLPDFVYDLCVENFQCYVANNMVVHNTTVASDISSLSGLLYPGTASLVVSHSMKGVKLVFDEINNTYQRAGLFRAACYAEPTFGSDLCRLQFKSVGPTSGKRTKISGVAPDINKMGQGIRGQRASRVLHVDEWVFLPPDLINGAILPCASNDENPMAAVMGGKAEDLVRFIFTSSSGYSFDPAFERMKSFRDRFMQGDPAYFYCNANYKDLPRGFVKETSIKMWIETIQVPNPGKFETEVMAVWTSEAGSWYSSKDVKGDIEAAIKANKRNPGGMWHERHRDPEVVYERYNHEDMFILGVDPAERQDQAGYCLIKVLPHRLVIMQSEGIANQSMPDIAETIRWFMDHYNITYIAMDPGGGGSAGVTPDLKRMIPNRLNKFTGKPENFLPVYPSSQKDMRPNEEIPQMARRLMKHVTFSSTSKNSSVTDMNHALRLMIQNGLIVVPLDYNESDPNLSNEKFDMIKKGYEEMMTQLIAVEAEPIEQGNKGKGTKNIVSSGRYRFDTKNGQKKDRYSALLIAAWEASSLQQQINALPDDEGDQIVIGGSIFGQDNSDGHSPWYGGFMS